MAGLVGLAIKEAEFTDQVLDTARIFRWRRAHFRPARTKNGWRTPVQGDGKGFPDLILLRADRGIASELKSMSGRLGDGQADWLDAFKEAGFETYIWRPNDLDEIVRILK